MLRYAFGATLDVSVRDGEGGALAVESVFDADLFEPATARRLAARYVELSRERGLAGQRARQPGRLAARHR